MDNMITATSPAQKIALLDASTQEKFVNKLINPLTQDHIITTTEEKKGRPLYTIGAWEVVRDLGLQDPETGKPLLTRVWAYGKTKKKASVPGPTLIAQSHKDIYVLWENKLQQDGINLPSLLPVDTTIH